MENIKSEELLQQVDYCTSKTVYRSNWTNFVNYHPSQAISKDETVGVEKYRETLSSRKTNSVGPFSSLDFICRM